MMKLSILVFLTVSHGLLISAVMLMEQNLDEGANFGNTNRTEAVGTEEAAPSLIPKPKEITSVTCEGSSAILTCGASVLNILSANYGRTDSTTCSAGRPSSQITKTNCYGTNTLDEVIQRCDDKSNCVVPATNAVFSDPCYGTYKYLIITYSCMFPKTSVTCEGNNAVLICGAGVLHILSANYGRTDSTTCSAGRPSSQITKTNCYGSNTLAEVTQKCEGKSSCVVPATNEVFSDPCYGTYKYLSIVYVCKAK